MFLNMKLRILTIKFFIYSCSVFIIGCFIFSPLLESKISLYSGVVQEKSSLTIGSVSLCGQDIFDTCDQVLSVAPLNEEPVLNIFSTLNSSAFFLDTVVIQDPSLKISIVTPIKLLDPHSFWQKTTTSL